MKLNIILFKLHSLTSENLRFFTQCLTFPCFCIIFSFRFLNQYIKYANLTQVRQQRVATFLRSKKKKRKSFKAETIYRLLAMSKYDFLLNS